jgi:hypothetical protein
MDDPTRFIREHPVWSKTIGFGLVLLVALGWWAWGCKQLMPKSISLERFLVGVLLAGLVAFSLGLYVHRHPLVVVNMPADAKPLAQLPADKVLAGDRAVLWWTVFKCTLDKNPGWIGLSVHAADRAVEEVYGPPHP